MIYIVVHCISLSEVMMLLLNRENNLFVTIYAQ